MFALSLPRARHACFRRLPASLPSSANSPRISGTYPFARPVARLVLGPASCTCLCCSKSPRTGRGGCERRPTTFTRGRPRRHSSTRGVQSHRSPRQHSMIRHVASRLHRTSLEVILYCLVLSCYIVHLLIALIAILLSPPAT